VASITVRAKLMLAVVNVLSVLKYLRPTEYEIDSPVGGAGMIDGVILSGKHSLTPRSWTEEDEKQKDNTAEEHLEREKNCASAREKEKEKPFSKEGVEIQIKDKNDTQRQRPFKDDDLR
jgi:hypothetical protein